jgi:uncharacterized RDD family membrane protein YckC
MRAVLIVAVALIAAATPAAAGAAAESSSGLQPRARMARAQPTQNPPEAVEATPEERARLHWATHKVAVRMGQDYVLRQGESVRDVVVVSGTATIEGFVRGGMVVVFGTARIGSTAIIDGSLVVVGGAVTVDPGATVRQDLVIVGGTFEGPTGFSPGRDHFVIGPTPVLDRVQALIPWLTDGLLLARPIAPRLGWVWMIVGVTFLVSLALLLIFLEAVRSCAASLGERPLSTFLVGLLVLLLTGPLAVILAASIVGLAVVPFLLCAVVIAWIVGKVGVAMWIGGSMTGNGVPAGRPHAAVAFVLGFGVITLAYMVPVLGFIVYGLVGVLGLGAATLAFVAAFRRENPAPPPAAAPPPPSEPLGVAPPPAPAAYGEPLPGDGTSVAPGAVNLALFPKAAFLDRLCAFALDTALVLIANGVLDLFRRDGGPILLLLAYHIAFWTWKGTTIGGIICQLRLVRVNGEPLRFVDALVRGLTSLFSLAVLGLGCLWILKDPERQSWHDKVAGTYVVKVPRNWPLP